MNGWKIGVISCALATASSGVGCFLARCVPALTFGVALLVTSSAWAGYRYRTVDLAGLPFTPSRLNARGQMAGSRTGHVWVFAGATSTDLGSPGGESVAVTGFNDAGQIAGTLTFSDGRTRAFLWSGGVFTLIEPLSESGGSSTASADLSNAGVMVGDTGSHTFVRYADGSVQRLTNGNRTFTEYKAAAVNLSGSVVETATSIEAPPAALLNGMPLFQRPKPWDPIPWSYSRDLNDAGVVAGSAVMSDAIWDPNEVRAFVFSAGRVIDSGIVVRHFESSRMPLNGFGLLGGFDANRAPFLFAGGVRIGIDAAVDFAATGYNHVTFVQDIDDAGRVLATSSGTNGSGWVVLEPLPVAPARLVNLSVRSATRTGHETTILGCVVGGGDTGEALVRAAGPALVGFNVPGAAGDPRLDLFAAGAPFAANDNWGSAPDPAAIAAAAARVWAFPFASGSKDAALLAPTAPGPYTAHVTASSGDVGASGIALAEIYNAATSADAARLINGSARVRVGTGDEIGIVGFVLAGENPCKVLIRAVGPTLAQFGVSGVLADPVLWLHRSGAAVMGNDNWGTAAGFPLMANTAAAIEAFPLPDGSKDAALLLQLEPGTYTAHVSGADGDTGVALIELCLVP
jgi:probable HAF family extracellular repeat protein